MLQQIRIDKWLLEVDIVQTRKFYNNGLDVCDCLYCKNFVEACKQLEIPVAQFLNVLGINPAMPGNLSPFPTEEVTRMH